MEKIIHNNILIAIRVKRLKNGSIPITTPDDPLQIITHKHSKNHYIKAHIHVPKARSTQKLQECLVVKKGKLKVNLYAPKRKFFKYIYLTAGETLVLIDGGWSVHMLKDSEFIEIKNGPFIEDKLLIEDE